MFVAVARGRQCGVFTRCVRTRCCRRYVCSCLSLCVFAPFFVLLHTPHTHTQPALSSHWPPPTAFRTRCSAASISATTHCSGSLPTRNRQQQRQRRRQRLLQRRRSSLASKRLASRVCATRRAL